MEIDRGDASEEVDGTTTGTTTATTTTTTAFEQQILDIVSQCPKIEKDDRYYYEVKPSRLSAELGLSIEDGTAELCGLLQAVGGGHDGASFVFETTKQPVTHVVVSSDTTKKEGTTVAHSNGVVDTATASVSTMTFHFPLNFDSRAKSYRRKEDLKFFAGATIQTIWKVIKIVTAFGLILSLFILTIAALVGMVAAIVAMSANNNQQHSRSSSNGHAILVRQIRTLFYTLRQLLWCYALYGDHDGRDPFMAEMAYDTSLCLSICCGSPGSLFWWIRVHQLNRRRQYRRRGWGSRMISWNRDGTTTDIRDGELRSDVEGVRLLRQGEWSTADQQQSSSSTTSVEDQRGLLSVAVEYLFGPTPFHPGPSTEERWKIRAAAIVHHLAVNSSLGKPGVSLQELGPFFDTPPLSIEDEATIVSEGLQIVAHFNGTPVPSDAKKKSYLARFYFPEIESESQYLTSRYKDSTVKDSTVGTDDEDDESWGSILCHRIPPNPPRRNLTRRFQQDATDGGPTMMIKEQRYQFTNLPTDKFMYCIFLGTINLIGVIWLRSSLEPPNGVLQQFSVPILTKGLVPVLFFYAILFFILPLGRLVLILVLNRIRKRRNEQRRIIASLLSES